MKKFFPVLSRDKASSSTTDIAPNSINEGVKVVDYKLLETDPGIRPPISSYHPDIQDECCQVWGGASCHLVRVFGCHQVLLSAAGAVFGLSSGAVLVLFS